jgi:hypothetical protein
MTTDLKPDIEEHLADNTAGENTQTPEDRAREMEAGFDDARRERAIAYLRKLRDEGDIEEQRETFEVLRKGLNEAHPDRLIFPPELKGITW